MLNPLRNTFSNAEIRSQSSVTCSDFTPTASGEYTFLFEAVEDNAACRFFIYDVLITHVGQVLDCEGVKGYCFGFQGQEKDDELKGAGNSVNYTYRKHDPRLGRFFAVDPLAAEYPWNSPYAFSENGLIDAIELEGLEAFTVHGMGGSPKQYQEGGENRDVAQYLFKNYTNHKNADGSPDLGALNNDFSWKVGRRVSQKSGERKGRNLCSALQTYDDRKVAAEMLVEHVLTVRQQMIDNNEITSDEEITLIGFSAGGLVSMQAAEMLASKGYKINIITVNTPASKDQNSIEHPSSNSGINDMLIFKTKGDKLSRKLVGASWSYKNGSVPEKYQQVEIESTAKIGLLKHFAMSINIDSIKSSEANKLDPVEGNRKNPRTPSKQESSMSNK